MTPDTFLPLIQETLMCKDQLTLDTDLHTLPEWDSMSAMAVLALAEYTFGKKCSLGELKQLDTVRGLYELLTR